MKELYIIRHGETDYNKKGLVQGRGVDADLNDNGRLQAQLFYNTYAHVPFDKVYTSTLKRTHQTAKHFIDDGIAWEQLSGLDEMDWGNSEGLSVEGDMINEFKSVTQAWAMGDYHISYPGGESALDVSERQDLALNHILSNTQEKKILICMHGRALRLFMCKLTGSPISEMDHFPHKNTSLYRLAYQDGIFEVLDFNNLSHLYGEN